MDGTTHLKERREIARVPNVGKASRGAHSDVTIAVSVGVAVCCKINHGGSTAPGSYCHWHWQGQRNTASGRGACATGSGSVPHVPTATAATALTLLGHHIT